METPRAIDFADMAIRLHDEDDVGSTLESILKLVCETVHADMAGVMLLRRGGRVETAAVTEPLAKQADDLQLTCNEGPCLEAMDDQSFIVDDTATEERWAQWCREVTDLGIRSVLSIRLFTRQATIGALNIYGRRTRQFGVDDARVASIFAGHASVALAAAQTESGLRDAVEGRHLIGLAQGILMERFNLDRDAAFAVLRRYSQDRNIKLRAVANHVVEERALPTGKSTGARSENSLV